MYSVTETGNSRRKCKACEEQIPDRTKVLERRYSKYSKKSVMTYCRECGIAILEDDVLRNLSLIKELLE
jgi:hypothetical protein